MSEARLIELESRLAFQDLVLEKLNEAVIRQQQQIERLEAISKGLSERIGDLADVGEGGSADEVPPHY